MPDIEIWDTRSGNMLLSTPDLDEAIAWVRGCALVFGDEGLSALSVGAEDDSWVVSGRELLAGGAPGSREDEG